MIITPKREDKIELVFTIQYQTPHLIRGSPHGQVALFMSRPVTIFINCVIIIIPTLTLGPVVSVLHT